MLRHNFCTPDGRLAKLFRFSTLLDKSPLTSIYFATFEKKREVRSPLPSQSKFLIFGKYQYMVYRICNAYNYDIYKIKHYSYLNKLYYIL